MKLWKQITYILKPLIWNTAWKHLQQHPLSWLNQGSHWEHRWLILCWSSNISAFLKAVRTTNLDSHNFSWILSFHFQYAFSTFLVPQWKNIILALNSLTGLNSAGQGKVSFVSKEWIGLKLKLHLLSIFISVIQPNLHFYDPTKSIHEKHFHCINKVTIWLPKPTTIPILPASCPVHAQPPRQVKTVKIDLHHLYVLLSSLTAVFHLSSLNISFHSWSNLKLIWPRYYSIKAKVDVFRAVGIITGTWPLQVLTSSSILRRAGY